MTLHKEVKITLNPISYCPGYEAVANLKVHGRLKLSSESLKWLYGTVENPSEDDFDVDVDSNRIKGVKQWQSVLTNTNVFKLASSGTSLKVKSLDQLGRSWVFLKVIFKNYEHNLEAVQEVKLLSKVFQPAKLQKKQCGEVYF